MNILSAIAPRITERPRAIPRRIKLVPTGKVDTVTHRNGKKVQIRHYAHIDFSRYPGDVLREIRKTHR